MEIRISDEVERFIYSLEKQTIAKVLRTIDLLEIFGNKLVMPHSRKIKSQLFELRVRGAQEARILYAFRGSSAALLHGFIKKTDKIPKKEIEQALRKLKQLDLK